MEKTIEIDGKEVVFKTNGAVAKIYMAQFKGKDLLKDVLGMAITRVDLETLDDIQKLEWIRTNIDFNLFYDIAWVFAKTADPKIPEPEKWLASFEEFPILTIIEDIQELLLAWLGTSKKKLKPVV